VLFDGTVTDEHDHVAIGGHAEELSNAIAGAFRAGWDLATACREAVRALSTAEGREIAAEQVEAAVLDRTRSQRRKFRRLAEDEVATLLA
jgi:proteasome alpha subunit